MLDSVFGQLTSPGEIIHDSQRSRVLRHKTIWTLMEQTLNLYESNLHNNLEPGVQPKLNITEHNPHCTVVAASCSGLLLSSREVGQSWRKMDGVKFRVKSEKTCWSRSLENDTPNIWKTFLIWTLNSSQIFLVLVQGCGNFCKPLKLIWFVSANMERNSGGRLGFDPTTRQPVKEFSCTNRWRL